MAWVGAGMLPILTPFLFNAYSNEENTPILFARFKSQNLRPDEISHCQCTMYMNGMWVAMIWVYEMGALGFERRGC